MHHSPELLGERRSCTDQVQACSAATGASASHSPSPTSALDPATAPHDCKDERHAYMYSMYTHQLQEQ